jgi:lycopene beta-cyclase
MKRYDIILVGGGASGLSLACHLLRSSLRDLTMLIVEQDTKDQNDRTWGFWTDRPMLFDAISSHSWQQLQVLDEHFARRLDLHTYHYTMIRGIDFYRFAHQTIATAPHVDVLHGCVDSIEDGEQAASVLVDGQYYVGTWVFDSRFDRATLLPHKNHYHVLVQQFKGWEIETPEPSFDPQVMTLLDFRTSQGQGTHFFYVLPFSAHWALVESVLCATSPVDWADCAQAMRLYLTQVLHIDTYHIRREEQGLSPLTDWPFPRQGGKHIMMIGISGGRVKPSTGYAFSRIQQDAAAIVQSLLTTGHPFHVPPSPRRYRFFDAVMLEILAQHQERAAAVFIDLFRHNPVERIFRFLDEGASRRENALLVPSLPPQLLWQALLQIAAVQKV